MNPTIKTTLVVALFTAGATGCSHGIQRAEYPSTAEPAEEIARLDEGVKQAYRDQVDVLSESDLSDAREHLADAREHRADGDRQADILESLGYAKAYLDRANDRSTGRRALYGGILDARRAALDSGARGFEDQAKKLARIDDDFSGIAEKGRSVTADEFASLQRSYFDAELAAIQARMLGSTRAKIEGANRDQAFRTAPRTLLQAQIELKAAENAIAQNRSDDVSYADHVAKARRSADLLVAVVAEQRAVEGGLAEDVAVRVVEQRGVIAGQSRELGDPGERVDEALADSEVRNRRRAELKAALASARAKFSRDEAEVYEQGDKLLIRLKGIQFSSGRSELPPGSLRTLSKIREVADQLDPREVIVEGHTDAVGGPAKNKDLSLERAESVVSYLEASGVDADKLTVEGFGYERPISSNKTATGRAQNRRVDVWLIPGTNEARPAR